jgi:hypothetical protein
VNLLIYWYIHIGFVIAFPMATEVMQSHFYSTIIRSGLEIKFRLLFKINLNRTSFELLQVVLGFFERLYTP